MMKFDVLVPCFTVRAPQHKQWTVLFLHRNQLKHTQTYQDLQSDLFGVSVCDLVQI